MSGEQLAQLKDEVIGMWEYEGVPFIETENVGFSEPDPSFLETRIKPEYQMILESPQACVNELGYESLQDYLKAQN